MKNIKFNMKSIALVAILPLLMTMNSCTKNFKEFNTSTDGISDEQLIPDNNFIGGYFPEMIYNIVMDSPSGANGMAAVLGEYHTNVAFAGYAVESYPQDGPGTTYNWTGWEAYGLFASGYSSTMAPVKAIADLNARSIAPDFWAIALILQVSTMQRITDLYGPVPYSEYGIGGVTVPYDSQQSIYISFFAQLDTAVNNLKTFISAHPGATPFQRFDKVYAGDYTKWLKYANSLRLRLAMHIVKADPATAQQQALKAVDPSNGCVFTSNGDNAITTGGLNEFEVGPHQWQTARGGAAIISYLDGYNDPRLSVYFEKSTVLPDEYIGLKTGAVENSYEQVLQFSNISYKTFTPETAGVIMSVSEVKFLLAEGALRGWNMGGATPQSLYEEGINSSLEYWGVNNNAYINNSTGKPKDYVDPFAPVNNSPALTTITVKWDEAASNEQKLERIITQKWIALFPNGTEGWTNFRRTGYPRLFPITASQNHSNGTISTEIQVRRTPYPISEYNNNAEEVAKAVVLLGGPDTGGTRLWWDVAGPNF